MSTKLNEIELFIIAKVKDLRISRGFSQENLSLQLNKGVGFIGDREAPSKNAKYNVRNLNDIAKVLKCSPKDFWPDEPL
ncbi:XRE family transcriptional regulator [Leeuwenhoekiella aequorea]|mgnify:CR=1 FL=1|uniref:XRE family transcriptional regulator n=1 Tax=Leeuwenhoekiella aequorea TaxID=283736 RepID=UPI00352F4027|tara:strand:- start:27363 stop:27599 length:237 start_codon:yes stop_codon:yes gene_type:complete